MGSGEDACLARSGPLFPGRSRRSTPAPRDGTAARTDWPGCRLDAPVPATDDAMTRVFCQTVRVVAGQERTVAFDIRRRVFQDEQGVPAEEEFDADDDCAIHVLAVAEGIPVGTARIV